MWPKALLSIALFVAPHLFADGIALVGYKTMEIPITPFSNMASGYQATNPGFRAVLKSSNGEFLAGGDLTIDAVIKGYSDDASEGTGYGKLVLRMDITQAYSGLAMMDGKFKGVLSICMAEDTQSSIRQTRCRTLGGNLHGERPFQWLNKEVDFTVDGGQVAITRYYGNTGEGGTSQQISLAAFHPAYGFAAPGKAFKDYQSPLVLDLDHNGKIDLLNVWNESKNIRFDLSGGKQKVRTGWVKPQDGFLFWDNGSGCVQDGTQLFGEFTKSENGKATYENGFRALAALTGLKGGSVRVARFPSLKVWRDLNTDGVCSAKEVASASHFIQTIELRYQTLSNVKLNEDNEIRITGRYVGSDGKKHQIADVWFKQRRNNLVASH